MLKRIDPLITADLLFVLAAMGHGDELAIVDRNFPAASTAQRLVPLIGVDVVTAAEAILTLLPIDTFVDHPLHRMEVVGSPDEVPDVQTAFVKQCETSEGRILGVGALPRDAFYERARRAFAVVATSEARPYGCFLVTKGVING